MSESAPATPAAGGVNIEAIITKYIELRDAKDALTAATKAKAAELDKAMKGIETYMMHLALTTGQTNFGCAAGTAFVTTQTFAGVADWEAVLAFVREKNLWNLLTKGVSKTVVKEYLDAQNALPPGVNWTTEKVIQIRRA